MIYIFLVVASCVVLGFHKTVVGLFLLMVAGSISGWVADRIERRQHRKWLEKLRGDHA
jgi:uncharacterized membrane protein